MATVPALCCNRVDSLRVEFVNYLEKGYSWDRERSQFRSSIDVQKLADEFKDVLIRANNHLNTEDYDACRRFVIGDESWSTEQQRQLDKAMHDDHAGRSQGWRSASSSSSAAVASRATTSAVYSAADELREQVMDADTERAIIESIREQAEKEDQEDQLMLYNGKISMKQVTKGVSRVTVNEADSSNEAWSGTERRITRLTKESRGMRNVRIGGNLMDGEESEEESRIESGGSESESGESFLLVEDDLYEDDSEFETINEERSATPRPVSSAAEAAEMSGSESWSELGMTEDEDD